MAAPHPDNFRGYETSVVRDGTGFKLKVVPIFRDDAPVDNSGGSTLTQSVSGPPLQWAGERAIGPRGSTNQADMRSLWRTTESSDMQEAYGSYREAWAEGIDLSIQTFLNDTKQLNPEATEERMKPFLADLNSHVVASACSRIRNETRTLLRSMMDDWTARYDNLKDPQSDVLEKVPALAPLYAASNVAQYLYGVGRAATAWSGVSSVLQLAIEETKRDDLNQASLNLTAIADDFISLIDKGDQFKTLLGSVADMSTQDFINECFADGGAKESVMVELEAITGTDLDSGDFAKGDEMHTRIQKVLDTLLTDEHREIMYRDFSEFDVHKIRETVHDWDNYVSTVRTRGFFGDEPVSKKSKRGKKKGGESIVSDDAAVVDRDVTPSKTTHINVFVNISLRAASLAQEAIQKGESLYRGLYPGEEGSGSTGE